MQLNLLPYPRSLKPLRGMFRRIPTLPLAFGLCYVAAMSATQVIEEIRHLPPAEQSRVLRFAFELARERQLSGETLSELAQRMADSNDSAEKKRLREEIHRGFYGV